MNVILGHVSAIKWGCKDSLIICNGMPVQMYYVIKSSRMLFFHEVKINIACLMFSMC